MNALVLYWIMDFLVSVTIYVHGLNAIGIVINAGNLIVILGAPILGRSGMENVIKDVTLQDVATMVEIVTALQDAHRRCLETVYVILIVTILNAHMIMENAIAHLDVLQ